MINTASDAGIFQLEHLESRRLLSTSFDFGLGPATSAVYCDYFGNNPRAVRVSVDRAVDYWLDWADDWTEAIADDVEDGFFGSNFGIGGTTYANFLRDFLPENNELLADVYRASFREFGAFIITSGGGASRGAIARFGGAESNVDTPSREKAARYEGGLFNDSASAGSLDGEGAEALTSFGGGVGGADVPAAEFSDTSTSAAGGFYGGGYG